MKILSLSFATVIALLSAPVQVLSFLPAPATLHVQDQQRCQQVRLNANKNSVSRDEFLKTGSAVAIASAMSGVVGSGVVGVEPAYARGRATFEPTFRKFRQRIIDGGEFYGGDFRKYIANGDWENIKKETKDAPKKKKNDGITDRLSLEGKFSEARVLNACDLFAGAFSDNSYSDKTKKMLEQTEILHSVVQEINLTAKIALGEESPSGGLFGFGAKKVDKTELLKTVQDLYVKGGTAYNQYIFYANEDLALQFERFPFLE